MTCVTHVMPLAGRCRLERHLRALYGLLSLRQHVGGLSPPSASPEAPEPHVTDFTHSGDGGATMSRDMTVQPRSTRGDAQHALSACQTPV